MKVLGIVFGILCVSLVAFGQEIVPPNLDELGAFIVSLGGLSGASALAIVAIAVQGVMLFLRSSMGSLLGQYRLVAVLLLSLVGGVVALRMAGVGLGASLVHSSVLAAAQVLFHQIYKQFIAKDPVA